MREHTFCPSAIFSIVLFTFSFFMAACDISKNETGEVNTTVLTAAAQTIDTNNLQLTVLAQQVLLTSQAQTLAAPPPTQPQETLPLLQTTAPALQTEAPPVQTETQPTLIPTVEQLPPQLLKIGADVDTKCRTGPSPDYPVVSYLLVGQQSVVVGANPDHSWWLIEDPRKPGAKCWVWGSTTQVLGDMSAAPVVEPPPPPVVSGPPNFQVEFTNVHNCGGVASATFRVYNSGGVPFQSSSILIKDLATDLGIAGPEISNTPFMENLGGCPPGHPGLEPGNYAFIAKGIGATPSSGAKLRAIIVLCTELNQSGQCVEQKVTFVFP
jgi:hypothetical protein